MDYDSNEIYKNMTIDELLCIGRRFLDNRFKILSIKNKTKCIKEYDELMKYEHEIVMDMVHFKTMEMLIKSIKK